MKTTQERRMRSTSGWFAAMVAVFLLAPGCGGVEPSEAELFGASYYFGDAPATLTLFSEAGFWGSKLTVQIDPSTPVETVRLVTKTQIANANLLGRISAVRLKCGSRAGRVVLFNAHNTATSIGGWSPSSPGRPINCSAGETVDVNLHAEASFYADKVASVYFVAHARKATDVAFSTFVSNSWNAELANLPSGAKAVGEAQLQLTSSTRFRLRQNLKLDDWKCGGRSAHMVLQAQMYQDQHFSVIVATTYVDTGWGDAWGCRSKMQTALKAAAINAASDLRSGLDSLMLLAGNHPRYYFVPSWSLREFDLAAGGEPQEPLKKLVARR